MSRKWKLFISLSVGALVVLSARADSPTELPMPIKTSGAPAIDLVYHGKQIDRDEATDLAKSGVDLSTVDPLPSINWQSASLPVSNVEQFAYPPASSQVHFLNDIEPNGMYRGQVEYYGRPFRLVVDMDNREAIMNAGLLRRLGYPVDMPKAYKELSIRFDTLAKMKAFIDGFAFETQYSRDMWLKKADEKNLIVTLKDVNLEYPRIDVPQLYNGIINTDWVAGHRANRALIIPLMLTDVRISENGVNVFPWEFTRIFGENIMLSHAYVSAFHETTFEDARWVARKIALLTKPELKAIVDNAGYPEDIAALLLEKITARRNQMVTIFKLASELPSELVKLPYDVNITIGAVKKGEATRRSYADYAPVFSVGDPASPLRWSELKHYVKMETIAQGVAAVTSKMNQMLQFRDAADAVDAHKEKLLNDIIDHFKAHPNDPYVMPLKPWVESIYGLNANASRALVTGTYYGSDSKAQLVDNLSIGASIGAIGGVDGRTYLQNFGIGGAVGYQRTYTHVRPIASLEAVKNEKWKNLFVPGFLKGTSKVLLWKKIHRNYVAFQGDYLAAQRKYAEIDYPAYTKAKTEWEAAVKPTCESQGLKPPYTDCKFDAEKYPRPSDPAPDVAALYAKDIGSALPSVRYLPAVSSDPKYPSVLPDDLEDTIVLSTLRAFLDDVRDNEVYTITDSFVNQVSPQVQIPLTTLAGMGVMDLLGKDLYSKIAPSVGVSVTGQWAILKRLMFMRKGDQFTAYDTKMNTRALGGAVSFTAWIELAKGAAQKKKGIADTDALMLDLSPATNDDKAKDKTLAMDRKKLLMAIADLMSHNEIDTAAEYAPAYALHHEAKGKTRSAKILLWNWTNYAETHSVSITPPADPDHAFDPKAQTRTLYAARKMNLSGKNPYGLMGQVLSKAVGVNGLLDSGTNENPSGTFLGSANWSQVRAEAEVTAGREFKPMLTLEEYYSGWFLAKDKLLKILDSIQSEVNDLNMGSPIFRRDMFNATTQLQAYQIRSNVILYPSGVDRLEKMMFGAKSRQELLYTMLDWVNPEDFRKRCRKLFETEKLEPELEQFETISDDRLASKTWNRCIQPWMRKVMRHVKNAPARDQKERYTEWLSTTMYLVNKHLDVSRFLNRIGKDNFFMQVRVSGFRKGDEAAMDKNGETDYLTDTIGTVQSPISLGAFSDMTFTTKGVEWQPSAWELQMRYFGDGK